MEVAGYRIERPLGDGGSSTAWVALDRRGRRVALKLLHPDLPPETLRREFHQLSGRLHPHLVEVFDFGAARIDSQPRLYYTCQLIEGAPWRVGRWTQDRAILIDVLKALTFLHGAGLRHGDLKPDNVLVEGGSQRGILIDLGCAAPLRHASTTVSGTPSMMAPELLRGEVADERADLFALGRILEKTRDLPAKITALQQRLIAPDPRERPSSAQEVLEALGESIAPPRWVDAPALLGRDALLADFEDRLQRFASGVPGPRALTLQGASGAGRTRLLKEFKWRAQLRGNALECREPGDLADLGDAPSVVLVDDLDDAPDSDRRFFLRVARRLSETSNRLLVLVSSETVGDVIEVGPLDRASVARWVQAPERVDWVLDQSGGYPREIRAVLSASVDTPLGRAREIELAELSSDAAALVGCVAALRTLRLSWLRDAAISRDAVAEANEYGFLRREDDQLRLLRENEAEMCRSKRDATMLARLADVIPNAFSAQRIAALALAGRLDDALAQAREIADEDAAAPMYRVAAWALLERSDSDPRARFEAARLLEGTSGEGAMPHYAALFEDAALGVEARIRWAACALRLERLEDAKRCLDPVDRKGATGRRAADLLCRILIKQGEYARALAIAEEALPGASGAVAVRLDEDLGVAASYLGDHATAARHLGRAVTRIAESDHRGQVRVLSYLAIDAWRRGELREAATHYEQALRVAERHDLDDQLAPAAINCGALEHSRGSWGRAIDLYQRGLRGALALGQQTALATLTFNLTKLYADVGAFDRAREFAERADDAAKKAGSEALGAAVGSVRAEIANAEGNLAEAQHAWKSAEERFSALGAEREVLEVRLARADALLQRGEVPELPSDLPFADLKPTLAFLESRLADDPRPLLEALLQEDLSPDLRARVEGALADAWHMRGATTQAQEHAALARAAWERIAADLPLELRDAFWSHPLRARAPTPTPTHHGRARHDRWERLIAINRKLSSSLEIDAVLHMGIDAAIELTGAERGFLVLEDEEGELRVRVARNLDRERIGRSRSKLSWSLAEQVVATGEPVLTTDAQGDDRFREHRSVHALGLRSVLAVPIPSPDGVRGALYLDNRFRRGRFDEDDVELLLAFADQLGIALRNIQLVDELRRQSRELEAERARVEALSRGQAAQIETLLAEVRSHRANAERRYEYEQIVARSPSMRAVLDTLDQVIDSPLTVLVQGESGTGKELIARAIHLHGATEGPFVAINCAALPDALLESELFGHVKGAFTGADAERQGLMVAAHGGTLFLDELGEMSLSMQAKLLRALETRQVRPVGGTEARPVEFRLVCATNRALLERAREGEFREDLYYRVGVVTLQLPSLRERPEDIPELVVALVARAAEEMGRPAPTVSAAAMQLLLAYEWPGNVRQLANVLATALVLADDEIAPVHLRLPVVPSQASTADAFEREELLQALRRHAWNVARAAKEVGMSRATLYRRMKHHRIPPRRKPRVT
ncbi:MAG: sigma 54-interacting transcriptional regulator [Myxococcota bacterium]